MIIPGDINTEFLNEFKSLVVGFIGEGIHFYIITGGGKISRTYVEAAKIIGMPASNDLDWLGIQATRINAELVRVLLREYTPNKIVYGKEDVLSYKEHKVVVSGGWQPGGSSDMATVMLAKEVGAQKIINLSNVSFVYSADPKIDPNAVKVENITWADYRKIIPKDWSPSSNTPFDSTASRIAEEEDMEVAIINGANLENLKKFIEGEPFDGTLIHN